jgi:hypothetical protein
MMVFRLSFVVWALFLGVACTAPATQVHAPGTETTTAEDPAPVASAQQIAATKAEDPLVCTTTAATGSRVAKKTCMRQSDIDRRRRDAGEMLDEVQRRSVLNNRTLE